MLGNKGTRKFYRVGGTRGGQDQFKWEDVKNDKYRENYLGHSVQAPIGRWLKHTELNWYAKDKANAAAALEEEKIRMRQLDEDLLNETLGLTRKKSRVSNAQLDSGELKQLLERGTTERSSTDAERVKGLGAAPIKAHDHLDRVVTTSIEQEIKKLKEASNGTDRSKAHYVEVSGNGARERESDSEASTRSNKDVRHGHKKEKKEKDKKEKKEKKDKASKKHNKRDVWDHSERRKDTHRDSDRDDHHYDRKRSRDDRHLR